MRIFYSLAAGTDETYQVVVERMEHHFGHTVSVIFNRALFTRNLQRPSKSIVQFLSTLREMACNSNFQEAQFEERVWDQCAAGCSNERIRERLL